MILHWIEIKEDMKKLKKLIIYGLLLSQAAQLWK